MWPWRKADYLEDFYWRFLSVNGGVWARKDFVLRLTEVPDSLTRWRDRPLYCGWPTDAVRSPSASSKGDALRMVWTHSFFQTLWRLWWACAFSLYYPSSLGKKCEARGLEPCGIVGFRLQKCALEKLRHLFFLKPVNLMKGHFLLWKSPFLGESHQKILWQNMLNQQLTFTLSFRLCQLMPTCIMVMDFLQ